MERAPPCEGGGCRFESYQDRQEIWQGVWLHPRKAVLSLSDTSNAVNLGSTPGRSAGRSGRLMAGQRQVIPYGPASRRGSNPLRAGIDTLVGCQLD